MQPGLPTACGDVLASAMIGERLIAKVAANFVIPYVTASTGALLNVRSRGVLAVDDHYRF